MRGQLSQYNSINSASKVFKFQLFDGGLKSREMKQVMWPAGMTIPQMKWEILRECNFPSSPANHSAMNLEILDQNNNVVYLSEDIDFNQVY